MIIAPNLKLAFFPLQGVYFQSVMELFKALDPASTHELTFLHDKMTLPADVRQVIVQRDPLERLGEAYLNNVEQNATYTGLGTHYATFQEYLHFLLRFKELPYYSAPWFIEGNSKLIEQDLIEVPRPQSFALGIPGEKILLRYSHVLEDLRALPEIPDELELTLPAPLNNDITPHLFEGAAELATQYDLEV